MEFGQKIFSWNWFIWFHEFFWPGLFKIFSPTVQFKIQAQETRPTSKNTNGLESRFGHLFSHWILASCSGSLRNHENQGFHWHHMFQHGLLRHSGPENWKKSRQKNLRNQINQFFSHETAFLAVLNFFPVQKLIFGHFWNGKKIEFVQTKSREIDLVDFTSFLAWTFFKCSSPL